LLHVETEEHHIAILDDVLFAFLAHFTGFFGGFF
jgi:hypothetical protein